MTLIAGIVSRHRDVPVPADACERLRQLISRNPSDEIRSFETSSAFITKLDIGAFAQPAVCESEGSVTMVAGEPLIVPGEGRTADTRRLHAGFREHSTDVLRGANGVFTAVHWNGPTRELTLTTDKLGIRPIYYWAGEDLVVFAGALRVLEELDLVPKVMDVRSVTELVGLGYILGDRTPYAGIRLLRPAEIVRFTDAGIRHETYWRWDKVTASGVNEDELLDDLYQRFSHAVMRRSGTDTATSAYLSGGLDSRCIVAALRTASVAVHTYNFARPQTQDLIFGREFAREIGAIHFELPKNSGDMVPDYSQLMADAVAGLASETSRPERPQIVWSGEGGSVALGHVHLTPPMVDWLRAGQTDRVIAEYIARESALVAPRLFSPSVKPLINGLLEHGIRQELGRLSTADPARGFYLYLLLNDQHRKLARHFENIDVHRLEFQLPFFDSEFIAAILAVPIDLCLRHRLYVRWLSRFPAAVTGVPWQVYPGHEPCPVPVSDELAYQWADSFQIKERSSQRRRESAAASEMLRAPDFPAQVLDRTSLRLAALIHRTGFRNYQYLLGPADVYHNYWKRCGGRYLLPEKD